MHFKKRTLFYFRHLEIVQRNNKNTFKKIQITITWYIFKKICLN